MAYQIVLQSPRGPRGMKRRYKDVRNHALREAGSLWWRKVLPEHFRSGAESKYRYKKRTPGYLRRKRREGRGQDPNVYTGRLRDKMTRTKPAVKLDRDGITLTWRGLPRYTFITDTVETKKDGKVVIVQRPNKPRELTEMTRDDADRVAKAFTKLFTRGIEKGEA